MVIYWSYSNTNPDEHGYNKKLKKPKEIEIRAKDIEGRNISKFKE